VELQLSGWAGGREQEGDLPGAGLGHPKPQPSDRYADLSLSATPCASWAGAKRSSPGAPPLRGRNLLGQCDQLLSASSVGEQQWPRSS